MTGSDFGGAFAGLGFIVFFGLGLMPLGLWKLVEIVIWLYNHIDINFV